MKAAVRFMKSDSGTYVLILKSHSESAVRIGRWGIMGVEPGYYIYVGSALGPGGVRSRVTRHWRIDKAKHWHIDHLREVLVMWNAWFTYSEERLEHRWANLLLRMEGMNCVPGFGCSDCKCASHLFQTAEPPDMASLSRAVGVRLHEMRRTDSHGVRGS